ncbi:hypothetical protein J7I97_25165, partial [Streptomyces sp. ISL-87]|nr:hypothetical protein [Streptomyces sp. ISL-87]
DTDAMVTLGSVLAVEGDMTQARSFLQQAAQAGHPGASEYAALLDDDPRRTQTGARAALSKRAENGDTDALNFLGVLEWRAGDLNAARAAWMSSRDADNIVAPILLRMTS